MALAQTRCMRRLILASLTAALAATAACGSDSPLAPAAGGPELRVMTFNIQHGLNLSGRYDLKWSIDTVARIAPDLVGMQELTRNHPYYNCDDQPARIADGVASATGRPWTAVYQQEWFTPIRECPDTGRGDGPATEGLGFLAPGPQPAPIFTSLHNGRIGLLSVVSRGRGVPVVNTHLAHGSQGQADRLRQLDALLPWVLDRAAGGPVILIGDFNHNPFAPEYARIRAAGFRDAWEDAVAAGTARGRLDGITKGSSRIDYVFYIPAGAIELLWIENVDTRALTGTQASDHNPLVAAFAVR
jgi:endonuclease/exonuclease/phosphatase family metal-dependent hydrolase